ncbi:hypothetical protein KR044_006599, partial [Drosophila immigrans]
KMDQMQWCQTIINEGQPSVAIVTKNGIVIVGAKQCTDRLVVNESIIKMEQISKFIVITYAGLPSDFRQLSKFSARLLYNYKSETTLNLSAKFVANELKKLIDQTTIMRNFRAYAVNLLIANWSNCGELFLVNCSGDMNSCRALCIGGDSQTANEYLDSAVFSALTVEPAITIAIEAIRLALGSPILRPNELQIAILDCTGVRYVEEQCIADNLSLLQ